MSKINDLTLQQRMFCTALFGKAKGNAAEAYRQTHKDFTGEDSEAADQGYRLKQRIINRIGYGEFIAFAGLTDERLGNKLNELMDSDDERVGVSAVKLGFQIRQKLVERSEVELSGKRSFSDVLKDDADRAAKETKEEQRDTETNA
jgi:hypothetical protein